MVSEVSVCGCQVGCVPGPTVREKIMVVGAQAANRKQRGEKWQKRTDIIATEVCSF